MHAYTILLTVLSVMTLLCVVAVVFFERKNPASSLGWILVLMFMPGVGFVLYMFFGSGFRINKNRRYREKAALDRLYNNLLVKRLKVDGGVVSRNFNYEAERLLHYLSGEGESVYTDDNRIEVFTDGNDKFRRLLEDIRAAGDHVHLLYYIFREDEIGGEIINALVERARAGVRVRLLYDSMGTIVAYGPKFRELTAAGGQVLAYSPLFKNLSSHLRINYRNHRKIAVVDGTIGYVGGMNVGKEYCGRDPVLTPWRDTHLRITGSAVWFLQERFVMDWAHTENREIQDEEHVERYFPESIGGGRTGVQIVSGGPDTIASPIKSGLLTMIYGAQRNVFIQTPYFAPDLSFLDALRVTARSGVDVKLMLPALSDHKVVKWATHGYARQMLESGVEVFLYRGFLHSKTIVVDGKIATIGSTNITNRSFTQNFEINAFMYDTGFAAECERIFERDLAMCDKVDREWYDAKSLASRGLYNCARLLAPLI